ncbi:hypothetical protein T190423A01A_30475 [Tenacibaculum sp. 190130A14a]|uniref:Uncharacterized protein n=1 Tax=Tenacibaculum polynesiense TaxID=3137857 RepID=A0ABP1F0W8_9FLAO
MLIYLVCSNTKLGHTCYFKEAISDRKLHDMAFIIYNNFSKSPHIFIISITKTKD